MNYELRSSQPAGRNSELIDNIFKEQCFRWHRLTSLRTLFSFYHLPEFIQRHAASANLHKRPHHSTHHITQETVGGNLEVPLRFGNLMPLGMRHLTQRRLHIAARFAEGTEILILAEKKSR